MGYLLLRSDSWYFSRRIPKEIKRYDSREYIRFSLQTDSKKQAKKLASIENAKLEQYWETLSGSGNLHNHEQYRKIVERASLLGFTYQPLTQIVAGPFEEFEARLLFLEKHLLEEKKVEAVLGAAPEPVLFLKDLWHTFADLKQEVKLNKSHHQYNKWKNPRIQAVNILISLVEDKPINKLTRRDLNSVKKYWLNRIKEDNISSGTVNKQFIYLKTIIETISDNYDLDIPIEKLFKKLLLKERYQPRLPFTTDHIINVLLKPENLAGLKPEYQAMLNVLAETGIGFDEQVGILPNDIFLNADIPHVIIQPSDNHALKTEYRKRIIPLTGFALDAFKKYPRGFSGQVKIADHASFAIGKHLKDKKLLPSKKHSAYSLRHSFQDRLTNADCPDRIQTDLMGHRFKDRVKYGEGGSLEKKHEWLKKIQLKHEAA